MKKTLAFVDLCWKSLLPIYRIEHSVFYEIAIFKKVALKNGVPQIWSLGPSFSLLYLNALMDSCRYFTPYLFADDTCLLFPTKPSCEEPNKEITSIVRWLHSNKLEINHSKSFFLNFIEQKNITRHRADCLLNNCHCFKCLGLTVLYWLSLNIRRAQWFCFQKMSKFFSILALLRKSCNRKSSFLFYWSTVGPVFEYGDLIYGCTTLGCIQKMEKLQKKILRRVFFKKTLWLNL